MKIDLDIAKAKSKKDMESANEMMKILNRKVFKITKMSKKESKSLRSIFKCSIRLPTYDADSEAVIID